MQLVVVDCETSTLDHRTGIIVELAFWNLDTDFRLSFVPPHSTRDLVSADPESLKINGYWDRLQYLPRDNDLSALKQFHANIKNNRLIAANPAFDAGFLVDLLTASGIDLSISPWHHRMLDIETYVAGHLGLDPKKLPGLRGCCEHLGVPLEEAHTASGDVTSAGLCLKQVLSERGRHRASREQVAAASTAMIPISGGAHFSLESVKKTLDAVNVDDPSTPPARLTVYGRELAQGGIVRSDPRARPISSLPGSLSEELLSSPSTETLPVSALPRRRRPWWRVFG